MSDGYTRTAMIVIANAVNRAGKGVVVEMQPLQEFNDRHLSL
jgi:hypothetical protein